MKKISALGLCFAIAISLFSFSACSQEIKRNKTKIVMWTFQNQVEEQMINSFEEKHDNVEVEVIVYPWDTYFIKLRLALQSGKNVPDIFQLEATYLGDFMDGEDAQYMYNLSDLGGDELIENMIPYVGELGRNKEGQLLGVCDHTCAAGYNYNKEAAVKYLGTSDYNEIQNMVRSWEDMIELSKAVSDKGGYLIPSLEDIISVEKYNNGHWTENGKFIINSSWNDVIDVCRGIRENHGDAGLIFETDAYESAKIDGNTVFWMGAFDNYVNDRLKDKFGVIEAPKPYYLGGTYNYIYSSSNHVDIAYDFIKYISLDEWQEKDMVDFAVLPSSEGLYEKYKGKAIWVATGDQPVLDLYHSIAERIEPQCAEKYDEQIYLVFVEEVLNGMDNRSTNEEILTAVMDKAKVIYPELF